jgi:hypothetical protein
MTTSTARISPQHYARLAGLLYLLVIPLGIFGALAVPSMLIVPGDAAATARNLIASESLFRLGIVSDLLASVVLIVVVLVLYQLLMPVNQSMAMLMVAFLLAAAPIAMLNKLNQLAALQVLNGADYLKVFSAEQLQSLALFFLRLHNRGSDIAYILWGLWLLPLGYLVFKSGFLPKILGVLLMIACFGYLIDSLVTLLGYSLSIGTFAALGEIAFIVWLLVKGVNVEQWQRRAAESTA